MEMTIQPYLLTRDEGKLVWFLDSLAIIKSSNIESSGLGLIEQIIPTGDSPYHIHHNEDEAFYILAGEMSFVCGERAWKGGAGTYVFLPRGIAHGFRVEGEHPARVLLLTTPSGFEQFIIEMGIPASSATLPPAAPLDFDKLMEVAPKYGLEILGPLPEYSV